MSTKFTKMQEAAIIADYAECRSFSAVARKFKTSDKTVKRILLANPDVAKTAEQKAEANRQDILAYMDGQSDRVCNFFDKFLTRLDSDDVDKLELDKLAKVFGIVFDKFCRPAQEVNMTMAGKIKVELEERIKEWAE